MHLAEAWTEQDFQLTMAFQPIVDTSTGRAYGYEALVRGRDGEGAAEILGRVVPETRYAFDQQCRVTAIETAVAAGIIETGAMLSINFMPDVIVDPIEDSQRTLRAARETRLPPERLMFEFNGDETIDPSRIAQVVLAYRSMGMKTAFDDYGARQAGPGLLSRFTPDAIKLTPKLVRGLCSSWSQRIAVERLVQFAQGLGIRLIAEGVETAEEYNKLRAFGIRYMQGYLFAHPTVGRLCEPRPPALR